MILKRTLLGGYIYCVKYVSGDRGRESIVLDVTGDAEFEGYVREIERK